MNVLKVLKRIIEINWPNYDEKQIKEDQVNCNSN